MKKYSYLIALIIVIAGCRSHKKYSYAVQFDPEKDGNHFADSLTRAGVDTLVSYYNTATFYFGEELHGYAYPQTRYYIYWVDHGTSYLTKFTEYTHYNTLNIRFDLSLAGNYFDTLVNEKFYACFQISGSRPHYETTKIKLGERETSFTICDFDRDRNASKRQVIFTKQLDSFFYSVPPSKWHGLNYVKVKKE